MALHLTVADRLAPLADRLGDALAALDGDPFLAPVVVIPSEGIRSWLVARLAEQHGIVANVEFCFPGQLVGRALGDRGRASAWQVGPLTWAIHRVLTSNAAPPGSPAPALVTSRALADLFDRYSLHRTSMIHAWEHGHDLDAHGRPLPDDLRWQPELWRAVASLLPPPSTVGALATATRLMASGEHSADLPAQVHLFGLTGLPAPHLELLNALSIRHDVRYWVPTPSVAWWQQLLTAVADLDDVALARSEDPTSELVHHPLGRTWSAAQRESLVLLARAALRGHATVTVLDPHPLVEPADAPARLLDRLRHDLRTDTPPPGTPLADAPDLRARLDPDDRSVSWHRCHGAARQAEVLRDELIHLLHEVDDTGAYRYQPRDIAVLCPDIGTFAPLVEAAFAGDPDHGVPAIPLRVADRSLRTDLALVHAVSALLELLFQSDERFRASDVLALLDHPPVRQRFGLTTTEVGLIAEWVEQTNIRWGLDPRSHRRAGLPAEVTAYSWQAGLDQLLLGATLPDGEARLGLGHTVPFAGIEGELVLTLGKVAEVVHQLGTAHEQLRAPAAPAAWCAELGRIAHELFEVSDDDAWHWDVVHRALDDLASDAQAACWPPDEVVPAEELARLLAARFQGLPGPARFGTGAVTLSSLVALRGVPHPVVCLLGLDADLLGAAVPAADDLMALDPHVGDRDAGRELRATLLDALLATGDRLVLVSTGRDLRTNTEIPPAVPIAELMDLVDATAAPVHGPDGRPRPAHHGLAVDHPRQSWSERNFLAGQLGRAVPFSHDAGALAAARVRRGAPEAPDDALLLDPEDLAEWDLDSLIGSVEQPARALLRDRLGVVLPDRAAVVPDLIPLSTDALGRWQLSDDLLQHRIALGDEWDSSRLAAWAEIRRRSGRLPPMGFGELPAEEAAELIDTLLGTVESLGLAPCFVAATRSVDITVPFGERTVRVAGEVTGVIDDTVVVVTPSKLSGKHLLGAWLRLAALTAGDPDRPWAAVVVARDPDKNTTTWRRLRVHDPGQALVALTTALDLAVRARRSVVPFTAATGWAWHLNGKAAARSAWKGYQGSGDADDAWVVQALGRLDFEELLAVPPLDDETDPTWGESPSRFVRWSDRLWGTFTKTMALEPDDEHRDD